MIWNGPRKGKKNTDKQNTKNKGEKLFFFIGFSIRFWDVPKNIELGYIIYI